MSNLKRYEATEEDNVEPRGCGTNGGRPGMSKDGAAGVRVQAIMPDALVEQLDAWAARRGMGRGPAVRKLIEALFTGEWGPAMKEFK